MLPNDEISRLSTVSVSTPLNLRVDIAKNLLPHAERVFSLGITLFTIAGRPIGEPEKKWIRIQQFHGLMCGQSN